VAHGSIITLEVERIIGDVWLEHAVDGWTAKEVQNEVAKRVQEKEEWRGKYKKGWPGLRAVQSKLTEIKEKYHSEEFQKLEKPWRLDLTKDLPADAIAAIFEAKRELKKPKTMKEMIQIEEWNEKVTKGKLKKTTYPLKVREALWVTRLYKIRDEYTGSPLEPYFVLHYAKAYADYERLCDIVEGLSFDTTQLDEGILDEDVPSVKHGLIAKQNPEYKKSWDDEWIKESEP